MADETHHRDVNHTFADMKSDDPNPFVATHKGMLYEIDYLINALTPQDTSHNSAPTASLLIVDDVAYAWRLKNSGERAWSEGTVVAPGAAKNSKPVYKENFAH